MEPQGSSLPLNLTSEVRSSHSFVHSFIFFEQNLARALVRQHTNRIIFLLLFVASASKFHFVCSEGFLYFFDSISSFIELLLRGALSTIYFILRIFFSLAAAACVHFFIPPIFPPCSVPRALSLALSMNRGVFPRLTHEWQAQTERTNKQNQLFVERPLHVYLVNTATKKATAAARRHSTVRSFVRSNPVKTLLNYDKENGKLHNKYTHTMVTRCLFPAEISSICDSIGICASRRAGLPHTQGTKLRRLPY